MTIDKHTQEAWINDVPVALKSDEKTRRGFKSDDIVHFEKHPYIVVRATGEHTMLVKTPLLRGMKTVYQAAFELVEIV